MLQFRGESAHSDFRLQKLLQQVTSCNPSVTAIHSEYWYFCASRSELATDEMTALGELLNVNIEQQHCQPPGEFFLVLPRLGTLSPWSSKATDIAHHCGLSKIERIERGIAFHLQITQVLSAQDRHRLMRLLHDRMTESVFYTLADAELLFQQFTPKPLQLIDILSGGVNAMHEANQMLGLALSEDEIDYLFDYYRRIHRNPTDAELMMFAQANSEHCRHKIFNASWVIDGKPQDKSLFAMIRNTHQAHPQGTLVAYADNASVIEGGTIARFYPGNEQTYRYSHEKTHWLMKVETHNHPTAISPFPGAATGVGGEIRDEGATGRGAKPKAGLSGFSVSNLNIPDGLRPWEYDSLSENNRATYGKPSRITSALQIMLEGPIGGAAFNNEFGRPNLAGYFRTFEERVAGKMRGYHKPIMLAGGIGQISDHHVYKEKFAAGTLLVQLGGPGMLIGLGGGAASSMDTGSNTEALDFDSVQRGNPEMQRRAQEVIDRCWQLESTDQKNPILFIHDVGAGGLSNAFPELVHDSGRGGRFDLRKVPSEETSMSPMQIWSNEAQERYVLAIKPESLALFQDICERERCPHAIIGEATLEEQLVVLDSESTMVPVNMPLSVLLGKPPKMLRDVVHQNEHLPAIDLSDMDLREAAYRLLRLPTVGDKTFLITIGDRSVGGLTARDQMVGPWQVPVADVAVTSRGFRTNLGEAFAIGERTPLALINTKAAARMAVGEAITNITAASIADIAQIKLSANWMAAAGHPGEDAGLYDAVYSIGMELCPQLGISIPVGKDSMSMKTTWQDIDQERGEVTHKEVTAPLSLIVSAFAGVTDVRNTLTPQLRNDCDATELILIDLGAGQNHLGGSALAQVFKQIGNNAPNIDGEIGAQRLKAFFVAIQRLNLENKVLAYHDRSDGGLFVTLCEMAFAGRVGVTINLDQLCFDARRSDLDGSELHPEQLGRHFQEKLLEVLFNEELGAVLQIRAEQRSEVMNVLNDAGLREVSFVIGHVNAVDEIRLMRNNQPVLSEKCCDLHRVWSETTYHMQKLRDNPVCAQQEYDRILDTTDPGLHVKLSFNAADDIAAPYIQTNVCPRMAILREQGVNGHVEMAAAFDRAGFAAIDVHMSDILSGRVSLKNYQGMVACGGFSYGDVLGAGEGWAKSILFNPRVRDEFEAFFQRQDSFALGVCNGCQMMSHLQEIIPGAEYWPRFKRNLSEQFEARFVMVEVQSTASIFFDGMAGSRMPITVAHGEGKVEFMANAADNAANLVTLRFIDNQGTMTENYPYNPNGSMLGITGLTTPDGRFNVLMPHPERVFRISQHSWYPDQSVQQEDGPWMRLFRNARKWIG